MENLKTWLHKTANKMSENTIKSITANHHYLNPKIRSQLDFQIQRVAKG